MAETIAQEELHMASSTLTPSWVERCETNGIKANRNKEFSLTFSGTEIYALLELLQDIAERGGPYAQMSRYVLAAETIRERAKAQGF